MIRVHTGRGWRYNPHLLAELRAVGGRGTSRLPIVDVLGMEVDGVDLFSGLSEDRIVEVTADLASALSRLASGYRRSQVACSGGAVELLLERRAHEVRLSMVRMRRPSEVLLRDLEIDLRALCDATLRSARGLLDDLRQIHPRLPDDPAAQRLARSLGGALGKPPRVCPAPPPVSAPEETLLAQRHAAGTAGFRLEVVDDDCLFESFAGGRGDLHSLLAQGLLLLEPGGPLPPWSGRGVPFLLLRDLVQSGLEVVRAVEQGDPEHDLPLGNGVALQLRLGERPTAAYVRELPRGRQEGTQGFKPCDPQPLLTTLFQAALSFGVLATRRNARQIQNQPLVALLSDAREGLARCREMTAVPALPQAAPGIRPARASAGAESKLGPGRLRVLSYAEGWQRSLPCPVRQLEPLSRSLIVRGEGGVTALSRAGGATRWAFVHEGALVATAPRLSVVALGERVLRVDGSRTLWQSNRLPRPVRSLACASHGKRHVAVAATDAEAIALDAATGTSLWQFSPPGAARVAVSTMGGIVLVSTSDGRLYGISGLEGKLLWRGRGKLLAEPARCGEWLLATEGSSGQLVAIAPDNGATRRFADLDLSRIGRAVGADWGVAVAGLSGGAGAVAGVSTNGAPLWTWAEDERLGAAIPLLVPVSDGILVRSARSLSRLGADGAVCWSHPLSDQAHDGLTPVRGRGVVVAAGDAGVFAFDEETGAVVGQVGSEQAIAALAMDRDLNVYLASEDGTVRALQVQRFLSVL